MIGLDTNVLVRYLVQDDAKQSQQANKLIEKCSASEDLIFINAIVLCELVWVLESAYEYSKKDIADVLEKILKARQFYVQDAHLAWIALRGYKTHGADFADNYIGTFNYDHDCKYTITFDKKAGQTPYFKLLSL